ncbi:predicted protein [Nematostella vectensis]|uniref:Uncharacterized protein n=1 Tax=Nematostella vectensis TaxID=45351 RepID=A7RLP9_NEMVE|nr:predicted protein [Nematostella vectensis]|eukprot:XP_001639705.1 predicted protein [Nematostella vectensis]
MATVRDEGYSPQSLNCRACHKVFTEPKILDCLHTFCQKCLGTHDILGAGTNSIVCPLCRKPTPIPESGVESLPSNFLLNNALDQLSVKSSKEYILHCTNCEDASDATQTLHRPSFCMQHKDEMFMFYCLECEGLICRECTILDHRGHKYAGLKDALEGRKILIDDLLGFCTVKKIPPVQDAVYEVKAMTAKLRARADAVKNDISSAADECVKRILARKQELLTQVDNMTQSKEGVLQAQQEQLEMELFRYTSSRDFVENVLLHGNEVEIIQLRQLMTNRLNELNGVKLDYKEPEENDVIDYILDSEAVQKVAMTLGHVTTSQTFASLCIAKGLGVMSGKVGVESFFTIETKDRFGNTTFEGDHCTPIQVIIQAPEGFFLGNHVANKRDGTLLVRYTPVTRGKHVIVVSIRGRQIEGSPFTVKVVEGIDYKNVMAVFMKIGSQGTKSGEFRQPSSVATDTDGNIYVTDFVNCRVQKFDMFGKHLKDIGTKGSKDGQLMNPCGVVVGSDGTLIVSDWDNHRVQMFSPEGKFVSKIGRKGSENGNFLHPSGLALNQDGDLVVIDKDNNRVQVLKLDGSHVMSFGSLGNADGQLDCPSHVAVTPDNGYLVTDTGNNRIVKFDASGNHVMSFGTKGSGEGRLDRPAGIAIDPEGFIIISDFQNHRVQVHSPEGEFYATFGSEGNIEGQFKFPSGIALTLDGHVIVADRHNHRIQVF